MGGRALITQRLKRIMVDGEFEAPLCVIVPWLIIDTGIPSSSTQLSNPTALALWVPTGPHFLKWVSVDVGRGMTVLRGCSSGDILEPTIINIIIFVRRTMWDCYLSTLAYGI